MDGALPDGVVCLVPHKIPEDARACKRRYYEGHKEQFAATNKTRQKNLTSIIKTYKAAPCSDCRVSYPYYVMHFDHVRATKIGNISNCVRAGWSVKDTLDEIAKCDVVCANCHAERTHQRRHKLSYIPNSKHTSPVSESTGPDVKNT